MLLIHSVLSRQQKRTGQAYPILVHPVIGTRPPHGRSMLYGSGPMCLPGELAIEKRHCHCRLGLLLMKSIADRVEPGLNPCHPNKSSNPPEAVWGDRLTHRSTQKGEDPDLYAILIDSQKCSVRAERSLLRSTLTMSRAFRIGVALAVLLAVSTVLIAPTIDMPETALREHQVASHSYFEHGLGGLLALHTADGSALLPSGTATHRSLNPQQSHRSRVPSSLVLRC